MNHVLEIDGVQLLFQGRKILSGIYLRCETGKITGLMGRNGQGKSCLMKIVYGNLPCEKSVRFDRVAFVESFKRPDLVRFLPQFHFIPAAVSIGRVFRDFGLSYSAFQHMFAGFAANEKSSVGSLSAGERRLLEIYVVVMSPSQFALLDEPFTHLHPLQIEKVKALLLAEKVNKGLLVTDHLYRHVIDVSDNVYVLTNGQTYLTKSVQDIESLGYARLD